MTAAVHPSAASYRMKMLAELDQTRAAADVERQNAEVIATSAKERARKPKALRGRP